MIAIRIQFASSFFGSQVQGFERLSLGFGAVGAVVAFVGHCRDVNTRQYDFEDYFIEEPYTIRIPGICNNDIGHFSASTVIMPNPYPLDPKP